jgi:hypothetical protein
VKRCYSCTYFKRSALHCFIQHNRIAAALRRLRHRLTALDYSRIEDIEVSGIDYADAPDFVDAYIASATYKGRPMSDAELDRLNEDSDFVYEAVQQRLY